MQAYSDILLFDFHQDNRFSNDPYVANSLNSQKPKLTKNKLISNSIMEGVEEKREGKRKEKKQIKKKKYCLFLI